MCVYTIDQKRWLLEVRENNPEFKRSRLAQEFKDNFGSDLFFCSAVSDWLNHLKP